MASIHARSLRDLPQAASPALPSRVLPRTARGDAPGLQGASPPPCSEEGARAIPHCGWGWGVLRWRAEPEPPLHCVQRPARAPQDALTASGVPSPSGRHLRRPQLCTTRETILNKQPGTHPHQRPERRLAGTYTGSGTSWPHFFQARRPPGLQQRRLRIPATPSSRTFWICRLSFQKPLPEQTAVKQSATAV